MNDRAGKGTSCRVRHSISCSATGRNAKPMDPAPFWCWRNVKAVPHDATNKLATRHNTLEPVIFLMEPKLVDSSIRIQQWVDYIVFLLFCLSNGPSSRHASMWNVDDIHTAPMEGRWSKSKIKDGSLRRSDVAPRVLFIVEEYTATGLAQSSGRCTSSGRTN